MFRKLFEKLRSFADEGDLFDPSHLGDPVAELTAWTPAKGGGANFRTRRLVMVTSNRIEFRASIMAKIFFGIFLLGGIGVAAGVSYFHFSAGTFTFTKDTLMPLLAGIVFAVVGGCLLYFGTAPVVFDKSRGLFWKGRKTQGGISDSNSLKHFTGLEDIHALQLISEYCRGSKRSYYSYELNLVLRDGKRINVIDHGDCDKLREDAETLSRFLERPVWDAI
ncbi:MAG: hypothetical protein PVJ69_01910 [Desulfobacteraceae bacterium]|jgi:hypothetical protein